MAYEKLKIEQYGDSAEVYTTDYINKKMDPSVFSAQLINANSSKTFTRTDALNKSPVAVLVKDNDSSSRTYNKYINAEGVATVAYDTNSFTVYNDSESNLYFTILA